MHVQLSHTLFSTYVTDHFYFCTVIDNTLCQGETRHFSGRGINSRASHMINAFLL